MRFRVLTRTLGLVFPIAGPVAGLATGAGCEGCDGGGFDAGLADVPGAQGTAALTWSLVDQATSGAVSCDQLDANATVFVEIRGSRVVSTAVFACKTLAGTSDPLPPGLYSFMYELHLSGGVVIPAAAGQSGVTVRAGPPVALAPITFPVDATGGLALMLRASDTGNCGTSAAGISTMSISLEHAGGVGDSGCAPVVFQLSGGGSYNAHDCSAPDVARCIEATETLTVPSLPSGPYQIHVRGKQGPLDCWQNNDVIRVPPQGKTLSQTLNLAKRTDIAGCL